MGKRVGLFIVLVAAVWATVWGTGIDVDSLGARMQRQRDIYPQEKFHVMTDRETFFGGDTIWARMFVIDAVTHQQAGQSLYAYLELRNPMNEVEQRVKLLSRDGKYYGYIPLNPNIAEGTYMLAAYTRLAENMGDDYFFRKNIVIKSPFSTGVQIKSELSDDGNSLGLTYCDDNGKPIKYSSMHTRSASGKTTEGMWGKGRKQIKVNGENGDLVLARFEEYSKFITVPGKGPKVDVTFHPEGGYLVAGESNKLAFKAINANGRGVNVKGEVVDSTGTKVADFQSMHQGMGVVVFIPTTNMKYKAMITAGADSTVREYTLPDVSTDAVVLNVDNRPRKVVVRATGNTVGNETLVLQCRGIMLYAKSLKQGEVLSIDKHDLPSGVIQALLIDGMGNTLSQRLFFVDNNDRQITDLAVPDTATVHSKIMMTISLNQSVTDTIGDCAVAVTDKALTATDRPKSIVAQLLLQSDLRGYIEDPDYYFDSANHEAAQALDALMLTQGWTRYDIPAVLTGKMQTPHIPIEETASITGIVKSFWRGKPIKEAQVSTIAPKQAYAEIVPTDNEGHFIISGVDFPNDTKFVFQATNKKGGHESNFKINELVYPDINMIAPIRDNDLIEDKDDLLETMKRLGRFNILLNEVTVKGRRPDKKPEDIYEILAAKSMDEKYFEERKITTIEEVLQNIAGINLTGGSITYRSFPVSIYIDGTEWAPFGTHNNWAGFKAMPNEHVKVGNTSVYLRRQQMGWSSRMNAISTSLNLLAASVPFHNIHRIDFLHPNECVVIGSGATLNGGALMITTKDGYGAGGWVQPLHLQVYNPLGYQKPAEFYSPKYTVDNEADGTDMRPTVYWNPNVTVKDGKATVEFFTSDSRNTDYTIRVEGLTKSGEIIDATSTIHVE